VEKSGAAWRRRLEADPGTQQRRRRQAPGSAGSTGQASAPEARFWEIMPRSQARGAPRRASWRRSQDALFVRSIPVLRFSVLLPPSRRGSGARAQSPARNEQLLLFESERPSARTEASGGEDLESARRRARRVPPISPGRSARSGFSAESVKRSRAWACATSIGTASPGGQTRAAGSVSARGDDARRTLGNWREVREASAWGRRAGRRAPSTRWSRPGSN
jgi:hypothetical protein